MKLDDLDRILGWEAVAGVEAAVEAAFVAANRAGDRGKGQEALLELLVAMLSTAVITPPDGAEQRVAQCTARLKEIVAEGLRQGPSASP